MKLKFKKIYISLLMPVLLVSNVSALSERQKRVLKVSKGVAAGLGATISAILSVSAAKNCYHNVKKLDNLQEFFINERCWYLLFASSSCAYNSFQLGTTLINSFKTENQSIRDNQKSQANSKRSIFKGAVHSVFTISNLATFLGRIKRYLSCDKGAHSNKIVGDLCILGPLLSYGLYKSSTNAYQSFKPLLKNKQLPEVAK
jgi:hypothetical protein